MYLRPVGCWDNMAPARRVSFQTDQGISRQRRVVPRVDGLYRLLVSVYGEIQ